jgi:N-acetyl-gamma-glutamyl-phosphate reductase
MRVNITIAGGAGYTGGELIRLLLNHPHAQLTCVHSKSNAGKPLASVHHDLLGETDKLFDSELNLDVDVLFMCLGHGVSKKFLQEQNLPAHVKVIDLSNDFRLAAHAGFEGRQFVYGLPELNRERLQSATSIANPGCFATAIQLGLLPLAKAGVLHDVYTTGITGSTGAGQGLSTTSHFSWRANNIQAYKTLTHQHLGEITESLHAVTPVNCSPSSVNFVPWRGDFTRGIFVSSTVRCTHTLDELYSLYDAYYAGHPFTHVTRDALFLKQVVNTNKCIIQIEKHGDHAVVHSVIDNLLKGASGQAVQNMNLMCGMEESAGLKLKANYF